MYERSDIETYLPGIWEESYWTDPPKKKVQSSINPDHYWHLEAPTGTRLANACLPEKRSATSNPKQANSTWAELIDVRRAWEKAGLTLDQKRALFLAYGLLPAHRFTQEEIGYNQGVSQQAVSKRLDAGMSKILTFLNGEDAEAIEAEELAA